MFSSWLEKKIHLKSIDEGASEIWWKLHDSLIEQLEREEASREKRKLSQLLNEQHSLIKIHKFLLSSIIRALRPPLLSFSWKKRDFLPNVAIDEENLKNFSQRSLSFSLSEWIYYVRNKLLLTLMLLTKSKSRKLDGKYNNVDGRALARSLLIEKMLECFEREWVKQEKKFAEPRLGESTTNWLPQRAAATFSDEDESVRAP